MRQTSCYPTITPFHGRPKCATVQRLQFRKLAGITLCAVRTATSLTPSLAHLPPTAQASQSTSAAPQNQNISPPTLSLSTKVQSRA